MKTVSKLKYFPAMTLMELIIVIAILGILAAVIMPRVQEARKEAKIAQARLQLSQIVHAIKLLENDTNEWPDHKQVDVIESGASGNEVWDLNTPQAGLMATDGDYNNWRGPYISRVPKDPWDQNYFFDTDYDVDAGPGEKWAATAGSFGPDGIGPNLYNSDDIYIIFRSE